MHINKQVLDRLLDDLDLNDNFQAEVIGFCKNDQHRLINLKVLALKEIRPPQLAKDNAVVNFCCVHYSGENPCCSKS